MAKRETSAEIDAAAADWAVRSDDGPFTPDEQAELDVWLAADARRLGAYARARAMLAHARRVKALGPKFEPDDFLAQHRADVGYLAQLRDAGEVAENFSVGEIERPTRRRFLWAGGAAATALATGYLATSLPAAAQTYATRRGEIRLVPLDDGSSMTLNTASVARVTYTDEIRRIELVEGEALFDVVRDAIRPFVVTAGDTDVRAVGTSFSVSRLPDAPVGVTVRQGVVEVFQPGRGATSARRLAANTQATAPSRAPITMRELSPDAITRTLAWREGMLSFEDMPLTRAAAEFARYSDIRIRFADPAIGAETVTGLFAANNPAGFAKAVAIGLDLRAETTSDGILLRR